MTDNDDDAGTLPQDEPAESPAEAIDRLAGELDGVQRRTSGRTIEFVRGSVVFAIKEDARVFFRLRPEIVAAGLNTTATARSERGPEWIELDTKAGDAFTVDRTVAWFQTAWRIAAEGGPPIPKPH
jgi:hypothetical protein